MVSICCLTFELNIQYIPVILYGLCGGAAVGHRLGSVTHVLYRLHNIAYDM